VERHSDPTLGYSARGPVEHGCPTYGAVGGSNMVPPPSSPMSTRLQFNCNYGTDLRFLGDRGRDASYLAPPARIESPGFSRDPFSRDVLFDLRGTTTLGSFGARLDLDQDGLCSLQNARQQSGIVCRLKRALRKTVLSNRDSEQFRELYEVHTPAPGWRHGGPARRFGRGVGPAMRDRQPQMRDTGLQVILEGRRRCSRCRGSQLGSDRE
jgi:hypothetical protein